MVNLASRKDRSSFRSILATAGLSVALLVSADASAAPTISGSSGNATVKGTINVSGSGFGPGPNVVLYDDFESGGAVGNLVSLTGAPVGNWTESVGDLPIYDSVARSGSKSMRTYRDGRATILKKDFPNLATEVYFSFWVRVPSGTPFPGDSGGVNKFSSDSSWKFAWLIDTSYDGSSSDLCMPTHVGGGSFQLAGNDFRLTYLPKGNEWWSWSNWMRMSVWLRADPSNPTGPGRYFWHVTSADRGQTRFDGTDPVFDKDGPSQKGFRYINLPGWIRTEGSSRPVYDDIYIASGANAQARIEIGDASTYAASKHLTLLVPKSWSATSISAELPVGALPSSGTAYLYVTDKDGNVNAQGYRLAGGVAPNPPTAVSVQ